MDIVEIFRPIYGTQWTLYHHIDTMDLMKTDS